MSSVRQADHYDKIISAYDEHYFDVYSLAYRKEFILGPLLKNVDFNGKRVADLACGSGHTSAFLTERFPNVRIEGFDISPEVCRRYRDSTGCPSHVFDLTQSYYPNEPFDAVIMIGGLHHCVYDLPAALKTVASMLKPGGSFLMFEPNADYFLQFARRIWYRADRYFDAETEEALSHDSLLNIAAKEFTCQWVKYLGGPAFFLVLNSLIFRLPHRMKRAFAPSLMALERAYHRLPGRRPYSSFVAHWIHRATSERRCGDA